MGDSTCLIRGFSYASAIPSESRQGNPMHHLGESISFGRFMNESLSWDKWSSFPHKKYVEEAERYAQPGSVAQKKAFFEAHYKRIAAQKAAALLEQENAAKNDVIAEVEGDIDDKVDVDEKMAVEILDARNISTTVVEISREEENAVIAANEASEESPVKRTSINKLDVLENQETVSGSEGSGNSLMERPLLKQNSDASEDIPSVTSKKSSGLSSFQSSIRRKTWKVPSTPAKPVTSHFKKENNAVQTTRTSTVESMDKKRPFPKSLNKLINLVPTKETISAPRKCDESSGLSHGYSRTPKDCRTPLGTRLSPMSSRKLINSIPTKEPISASKKGDETQTPKNCRTPLGKRPSPKSLRKLINLVPTKEPDKEPTFASKKGDESLGLAHGYSKTPKDCTTPLRTPNLGATKGTSKNPATTPRPENRCPIRLPLDQKTPIAPSGIGSKTAGPKWHVLSAVCSKSLTACRNKLQSPTTSSTPFILRTEERAARRKQKLEEKFNAGEVQQTELQKTFKAKAGNEFRKLGYSFCFKARPLPEFYKERETSINQVKKTPVGRPQAAVLGRSISNKTRGTISMPLPPPPPPTSSANNGPSRNPLRKNVANSSKFPTPSLPERITHENKSPNIQH